MDQATEYEICCEEVRKIIFMCALLESQEIVEGKVVRCYVR